LSNSSETQKKKTSKKKIAPVAQKFVATIEPPRKQVKKSQPKKVPVPYSPIIEPMQLNASGNTGAQEGSKHNLQEKNFESQVVGGQNQRHVPPSDTYIAHKSKDLSCFF
jgi:hypothetical protein